MMQRELSCFSHCLLIVLRMQRTECNLEEGLVWQSRDVGISPFDAGLMAQVSLCVA